MKKNEFKSIAGVLLMSLMLMIITPNNSFAQRDNDRNDKNNHKTTDYDPSIYRTITMSARCCC